MVSVSGMDVSGAEADVSGAGCDVSGPGADISEAEEASDVTGHMVVEMAVVIVTNLIDESGQSGTPEEQA